jgi:muramoyltetrapeptide carboxypeptidase
MLAHMIRKPRRLVPGDRVAVVASSGAVDQDRLLAGLEVLRGWGLQIDVMPGVAGRHERLPYLAADDAVRAKDFRAAWLDPSYKAVFCARGGYGAQRMLQHLDVDELTSAEPKLLVGFSDVTALHEIFNAAGVVTIHGPMAAAVEQLRTATSSERLQQLLFEPESIGNLLAPGQPAVLTNGRAEGLLRGGNVALLAAGLGTPTSHPGVGIVVLEDVGEDAYRLDRLLTQLLRAGWFDHVAGLVLGDFSEADDPELVAAVLAERLGPLGVPAVAGAAIGHERTNLAVPLGAPAVLNAGAGTLTLSEPPLSPPS